MSRHEYEPSIADDIMRVYFEEIKNIPMLSPEEEISLAEKIQCGLQATEEFSRLNGNTPDEKEKLATRIKEGREAKKKLVAANTRLVIKHAKKAMWRGVPFPDLVEEGNIGLMNAADRFDPKKGRFTTYATWRIKQSIGLAVKNYGRTIRVPVREQDNMLKARKGELDPTRTDELNELDHATKYIKSLDHPPIPGGDNLGEILPDEKCIDPEKIYEEKEKREEILRIILQSRMSDMRVDVLLLKLGFVEIPDRNKTGKISFDEVGEVLGISREIARKFYFEAIDRLNSSYYRDQLESFL